MAARVSFWDLLYCPRSYRLANPLVKRGSSARRLAMATARSMTYPARITTRITTRITARIKIKYGFMISAGRFPAIFFLPVEQIRHHQII
ncbi:MAG: hypothetical protein DSY90_13880 [Deltaproteobacteria bacterium]|nr:MAG: hypothetical protein DSY90_13880 [Deltaproteobacteria bacterium]